MRRCWWTVWIEVAIVAVVLFMAYSYVENKIDELVSPYLIEEDEIGERSDNLIAELVGKVEEKLGIRIDYENMIFDYANEYAQTMIEESAKERNAVSETEETAQESDAEQDA